MTYQNNSFSLQNRRIIIHEDLPSLWNLNYYNFFGEFINYSNKSYLNLFCFNLCRMSEQKERYFQRNQARFTKTGPRKDVNQSIQVKNSFSLSEPKEETPSLSSSINKIEPIAEERTPFSFATTTQDNLRKWITCSRADLQSFIQNKALRQQLKRQEKRLSRVRNDNKLNVYTDTELSILAINSLASSIEEYINEVNKQKIEKSVTKSVVRVNQQKEIARQLNTIDQQMELNNFASVKSTIQILLKKFGKDELLQDKLGYLNYLQVLNQEYERQSALLKDITLYVERLSITDVTPENINQSSLNLKNLKKQLTITLNKQNKKQEPNERVVNLLSQVDKIGATLTNFIDSKTEKKGLEPKSKRQMELEKELQQKLKSSQFLEQSSRYCRDLLEKTSQSKQDLYKQLDLLKKNKKKAVEVPYSLILRLYETIISQRRELNEGNLYLKACSQLYLRKNLNSENLSLEIKKLDEKYASNEILTSLKVNLETFVNNIQDRERASKQSSAVELELKRSRNQVQKLEKIIEDQKNKKVESLVQSEKIDKRKELEEKRAKDAEKLKQQKQQKEIERNLDNIYNNLSEKKWKIARNIINVFVKKYEGSTSSTISRALQSLNVVLTLTQELQTAEGKVSEVQKRQITNLANSQKQKQTLIEKSKSSEQYEAVIKILLEGLNQESFAVKKYFDEIRKDRKKIVQERYQIINRLEEPLAVWRSKREPQISENKNISLNLSESSPDNELEKIKVQFEELSFSLNKEREKSSQLETRLKESGKGSDINKDADELLNLVKRLEKGGEWWKFLPKNLKNSTFKPIYTLLEKYRENELAIQRFIVNEQLFKQEGDTIHNAIDSCIDLIQNSQSWLSEQSWEKRLANFRGNRNCDKLIACLRQLTSKANIKIQQERKNYTTGIAAYETEIQRLTNIINDLERRKDTYTEKSSKIDESSSKKSVELRSSRKVSKSREKEAQVKDAMQEFVQQEKNMLCKIDELSDDKHNLEMKISSIQNELNQVERALENQRVQFEKARFANEKIRLQQLEKINLLEGQIEISQGRRIQLQNKLDAETVSFNELQTELTGKLQSFQLKEQQHQEQLKELEFKVTSEIQNRLSSQLNYYRQMYGELSKELQNSKDKEAKVLQQFEALQKSTEILERKYQADMALNQLQQSQSVSSEKVDAPIIQYTPSIQNIAQSQQRIKMNPYKIDLNSQKIFDLYLDSDPLSSGPKSKRSIAEEKPTKLQPNENELLKLEIVKLNNQIACDEQIKAKEIQNQVINALKNQENDFNQFLKRFEAEKFEYFMNEILPKRLQEALSLKNTATTVTTDNSEFMHTQWIVNEFPRLYEERHRRQCSNADVDVQALVRSRLQERVKLALQEKQLEWEAQSNSKIEQSLFEFQQNAIPAILEQCQKQWEEDKSKQWDLRVWEIQQYWRRVLEEQKNALNASIQNSPEPKVVERSPEPIVIENSPEPLRQPTQSELLELIQRECNKQIVDILLSKHLLEWQQKKASEWAIKSREIQIYWQTVVIPSKLLEWQIEKEKDMAYFRLMIEKNDVQWDRKIKEVIIPQQYRQWQAQKIDQVKSAKVLNQPVPHQSSIDAIEEWKSANLPTIIEAERNFAIQSFIQIDLPTILEQQKKIWIAHQGAGGDLALQEELRKWEEDKQREIAFISASFDSKINQILQIEHSEWERLKINEIQQILQEEHTRWNASQPNIEEILQNEQNHWELVKLQEIRRIELDFQTRLNEIERKLNSQIIDYQQKYLKQQSRITEAEALAISRWKNNELPLLLSRQRDLWLNDFKSKELPKILEEKYHEWETIDLIQLLHSEKYQYIIDNLVSQRTTDLEHEKVQQNTDNNAVLSEIRDYYEKQLIQKNQLWSSERKAWQLQKEQLLKIGETHFNLERQSRAVEQAEREKKVEAEWNARVIEIENYWEQIVLPERQNQWRREQVVYIDQLIKNKIADVEATYQEEIFPNILKDEKEKWQSQYVYQFERDASSKYQKQKDRWISELPTLLKSGKYNQYLQPFLQAQASHYELQIKKIQAQSVNSNIKVEQLLNQLADLQSKLRENRNKYELSENKVSTLLTEHEMTVKRTFEESQRLNDQLTRSRWAEKEVQQLRKIIDMQKLEVTKLTTAVREGERLRLDNLNLQEANSNLQKSKWQQINDVRVSYQSKILQITNERNSIQSRVSQLEAGRRQPSEKDAVQSLERQIITLTSTLKTKDAEISFLKKTIDNVNAELRENREKLSEQLEKRGNAQRLLAELKSSRLQLDYQIKYLRDREESLTKKLDLKEQQMANLRKKIQFDNDSLEKKLKSSLQYATSYQSKYNELESLLSQKTKEYQVLIVEVDRIKHENQGLFVTNQSLASEKDTIRRQIRQLQAQKSHAQLQRDRSQEDINRLRLTLTHKEDDLRKTNQNVNRLSTQINSDKLRYESELKRSREEILQLQVELKQSERAKRIEMERASRLERQLAEGGREAQLGEIEVLKKINRDVTDITATNRQLEMKCLLLQNRQKITTSTSEAINAYLLIQKHTDALLDYLLKESIIPNLEIYHKFIAESRASLTAGKGQEYFQLWQKLLKDLFQLTLTSRAQEMKIQAEELLRLRDEMTDVLERQIEASEGDQNQLVQDYKTVLNDIKSLVRQYVQTRDEEYLRLLCNSLGI